MQSVLNLVEQQQAAAGRRVEVRVSPKQPHHPSAECLQRHAFTVVGGRHQVRGAIVTGDDLQILQQGENETQPPLQFFLGTSAEDAGVVVGRGLRGIERHRREIDDARGSPLRRHRERNQHEPISRPKRLQRLMDLLPIEPYSQPAIDTNRRHGHAGGAAISHERGPGSIVPVIRPVATRRRKGRVPCEREFCGTGGPVLDPDEIHSMPRQRSDRVQRFTLGALNVPVPQVRGKEPTVEGPQSFEQGGLPDTIGADYQIHPAKPLHGEPADPPIVPDGEGLNHCRRPSSHGF